MNTWHPAGNRSSFNSAVASASRPLGPIGTKSAYGSVTRLSGGYVMKTMIGKKHLKIFHNEVTTGSVPGIQQVGPKVYAWRVTGDPESETVKMEYIMDDFTHVEPTHGVLPFVEYVRMKYGDACPSSGSSVYQKLKETLVKFWRITQGYHGDLHPGNLAVEYSRSSGEPIRVIIFDYGSHKKFKASVNGRTCFEDFLRLIDVEFHERYQKKSVKAGHFPGTKIRILMGKHGQPRRPNTNMLRGVTPHGASAFGKYNQSIMARMHPENQNLEKRGVSRFKMVMAGGNHNRFFVPKRTLNAAIGVPSALMNSF